MKTNNKPQCILICPHLDDEFVGLADIIESSKWDIKLVIFVTDSSTQFNPSVPTDTYYIQRMTESHRYLQDYGIGYGRYEFWNFPEQMWSQADLQGKLYRKLKEVLDNYKGVVFSPGDSLHRDHEIVSKIVREIVAPKKHKLIEYFIYANYVQEALSGRVFDKEKFIKLYPSQKNQIPPVVSTWFSSKDCELVELEDLIY